MSTPETYRFGTFELNCNERRLCRNGEAVRLAPKALDLLTVLVRSHGRLVSKKQLLETVWPGRFIEEGILAVHISALRKVLRHSGGKDTYIETVPGSGYRLTTHVKRVRPALTEQLSRYSVAVLVAAPPERGAGARDEAFAIALADILTNRLSSVERLIVRPLAAVCRLNGPWHDPVLCGRELRVDAVLHTRFTRTPGAMCVDANLIRSQDGSTLLCRQLEQCPPNLLATADELAHAVAERLLVTPAGTGRSSGPCSNRSAIARSADVYELFGRGRTELLSASRSEISNALSLFSAAIELDPMYAGAHAGLAMAHCAQAESRLAPGPEAFGKAQAAAFQALSLDNSCADAYVALATVQFLGAWDWDASEETLARALELNPSHTEALLLYGRLLECTGELERGLELKRRALERDPLSAAVHLQIALSWWRLRQYDTMIDWAMKSLELDPRHLVAREYIAGAWLHKGDLDRYVEEVTQHARTCGVPEEFARRIKQAADDGGRRAVFGLLLDTVKAQKSTPPMQLAIYYGETGDLDAAFEHLARAIDARDPCLGTR